MLKVLIKNFLRLDRRRDLNMSSRMSAVFIRNAIDEDRIQISFKFPPNDHCARTYNFDRLKSEELEKTLTRISANVSRVVNKKIKKKKVKALESETSFSDLDVVLLHDQDNHVNKFEPNEKAWLDGRCLKIDKYRMFIHVNVPTIRRLELPEVVMIGCVIRPLICVEFGNETDCHYVWFRKIMSKKSNSNMQLTDDSIKNCNEVENIAKLEANQGRRNGQEMEDLGFWEEVHRGRVYVPACLDEGCNLKLECYPVCGDRGGEVAVVTTKQPVIKGPIGDCPFEKRHYFTKELLGIGCFRFVTYNILAEIYADSDYSRDVLFPYCPTYALSMDYRKALLIKEISGYNADIICLQEVDKKIFEQDLVPHLEEFGLSGLLSLKCGEVAEGTATFYRKSKFRLLSQHNLPLSKALQEDPLYADIRDKLSKSVALQEIVFARTSVLQVSVLESTEDDQKRVLVATIHQYFHPRAPHVRLLQTATCIRHIEQVLAQYEEQVERAIGGVTHQAHGVLLEGCSSCPLAVQSLETGARPAVVFCGDLNSYPEAGVHSFITQKQISAKHADWYAGGKVELVDDFELRHTLDLSSACGYPRYTNYVGGFSGCLDYIYIESKHISPQSVVPMPSHEDVTRFTALPSIVIPSDHLALVCDLSFTRDT